MPIVDMAVEHEYYRNHPEVPRKVLYVWIDPANKTDHAARIEFDYEDWLNSNRQIVPPDLVEWLATYGYVRLRLKTWRLPIELTPQEVERWQSSGYYVTLDDFYHALARVAGGVAVVAGRDPQLTIQIIQQQLNEKLTELERLASLPLDNYRPKRQEWQIRKELKDAGLTGKEFELELEEELLEDDHLFEVNRFEKPFTLRQQLESFEWGMETLRPIILGETNAKLGLPNKELFDAFMQIDLNALIARLGDIDMKLRKIWRRLAEYDCYCLNADYEPKRFWWRHWEKQSPSRHKSSKK